MNNKNTFKILALVALLAYVISPVDALPGPVDDIILCIMYTLMNYMNTNGRIRGSEELDDKSTV